MLASTLSDASDIATIVIAVTGAAAVLYAGFQLRVTRQNARLDRVYSYFDRFSTAQMLRLTNYRVDYWEHHSHAEFKALALDKRADWVTLVNLIEEVAALYYRGVIDRDLASEYLGLYFEWLWETCNK